MSSLLLKEMPLAVYQSRALKRPVSLMTHLSQMYLKDGPLRRSSECIAMLS